MRRRKKREEDKEKNNRKNKVKDNWSQQNDVMNDKETNNASTKS